MFERVEFQRSRFEGFVREFFTSAPQDGFDAGHELPWAERFGDIIIRAQL